MPTLANPVVTPEIAHRDLTLQHGELKLFHADAEKLLHDFQTVRAWTARLCEPLHPEDYVVQSMEDASPTKWHIAHTSWFFETFLLKPHLSNYQSLHPQYDFLFNSYYNSVGERHCRAKRGVISRPTVDEAWQYRAYIDRHIEELLQSADKNKLQVLAPLMTLGLHHEQQHQELMATDFKHVLGENPLYPAYRPREIARTEIAPLQWLKFDEGVYCIGHDENEAGFAFDNESPRHRRFVESFALADRLVTNAEYREFMQSGGYEQPQWWLSAGWATVQAQGWNAPFYWENHDGQWQQFTLSGLRPIEDSEPVCHLSYFEADAFARWAGGRLPTETEWEIAAQNVPIDGSFAESENFHPAPDANDKNGAASTCTPRQMYGEVWQWTRSQYEPYPGYAPVEGALGEYNGKFMCNQFVLRGASCVTPRSHARSTYRNFFPPDARWQFTGLRLAKDE